MNELFDDLIKEIADKCIETFNDKSKSLLPSEEKIVENLKYLGIISKKDEDDHLILTAGIVSYALNEYFEIGRDELKILVIPQNKVRVIASQIYETLEKNEREYNSKNGIDYFEYELNEEDENYKNKQIELITDLLKKEYEKCTPIEVNSGNEDEKLRFNFAISNITENLKMFNFYKEKMEESIGVSINFLKQGEKEKYLIEISNDDKNLEISSNNLSDLKDKLVKLLEKNIEDTKELYENNCREDFGEIREKRLESLKRIDIKDLEIRTKANVQFEYEDNFVVNASLKIEKDDKLIVKTNFRNLLGNKELAQIIKNEDFSDFLGRGLFIKNSLDEDEYEKIGFTKRKTGYYMKRLDKIIEETSLKNAIKDINANTIACLFSDDKEWSFENFSDIAKEYFDISFNNRIDIIKDKESLVLNNLEELKLTTDDIPNNKEDKEKFIKKLLKLYKENSFNIFLKEIERMKQIEIDADYVYDNDKSSEQYILVESLNHLEESKNFMASSDFFNIQEYNINNLITITVVEEKIPLSKEQLDYFRTIDNKTKENLYDSVISYYKDMSDTMNGEIDKKSFLEVCDSFRPNKYFDLFR